MPQCPPADWPRISVCVNYEDAGAAIDWLCRAFGFQIRLRVDGDGGEVIHSELTFGDGLIMVGSLKGSATRKSPRSLDGANTQSMMVYVEDLEAHRQRAVAAGAKITLEPKVSDYGEDYWTDRAYECQDPEGHRWYFAERLRDAPSHG